MKTIVNEILYLRRMVSAAVITRMVVTLVGISMASISCLPAARQELPSRGPSDASSQRALLNRYCVTCHNEKLKTAGLMLDKMDVEHVSEGTEVWERVVRKLRTETMPPVGMPRPDKVAYSSLASYLETMLDRTSAAKPNPGRPTIHRLTRAEYANAIRDLLALDIDGESLFPADDLGYGFDNIGDVLSVSPMLLEKYLIAARRISRLAVGDPTIGLSVSTYDIPRFGLQDQRASEDLPFGSRGGIAIRHHFPLDGEYRLKIRLQKTFGRDGDDIIGLGAPHRLDVRLDGERIKVFTVGSERKGEVGNGGLPENRRPEEMETGLELSFPAKAGTHLVGVAFLDESLVPEGMLRPPLVRFQLWGWGAKSDGSRDPGVEGVDISGPYDVKGVGETPSRRKIFVCHPARDKGIARNSAEDVCARKILSTLARRAYRRPVTDADVQTLFGFYKDGRSNGDFEAGIRMALQGVLVSSDFLFRIERDSPNLRSTTVYRISDLDLASRLSFFLWSSIPDDQLLDLAERGKLEDREILEQQVRRMLRDSRSKALMDNFAGQWLYLRSIRSALPDSDALPDFDENLREAFQRETELFFQSMLREDRSVLDLLDADYTFVNERLARHYEIPNVYGSRFRRITLADENRWGLLGKGSILTVTSLPNRTSPVLRGKWVLESILGTPPPPPPPNVPALKDRADDGKVLTMRQRMEQHRANPACASCHSRMDPLGFALDNFDAIGRWRTTETIQFWTSYESTITDFAIDASGVLPDGTKFRGPVELQRILLSRPEQFVTTLTEKLLTYSLGRGVEYYDQPTIRKIVREAAPSDYRWSALILSIVKSLPFQNRTSVERSTTAGLY